MSLTIHHLRHSQSERIVWLCEELTELVPGFQYELVNHDRDPTTALAPPSVTELSPARTAPVMVDSTVSPTVVLAESQAIVEYIMHIHGQGNFSVGSASPEYAQYQAWYNFANGTLQPGLTRLGTIYLFKAIARASSTQAPQNSAGSDVQEELAKNADQPMETDPLSDSIKERLSNHLDMINKRLEKARFLGGEDLTAADIMTVFSLTTIRGFVPYSLQEYPSIMGYLVDIAQRPAYQRTLEKAERGMQPMIEAEVGTFEFDVFK